MTLVFYIAAKIRKNTQTTKSLGHLSHDAGEIRANAVPRGATEAPKRRNSKCHRKWRFANKMLLLHTQEMCRKRARKRPFRLKQQHVSDEVLVLFGKNGSIFWSERLPVSGRDIQLKSVQFCGETVDFAICTLQNRSETRKAKSEKRK